MKVYVQRHEDMYERMFIRNGYTITRDYREADIICYVGGEDVSPEMYMEDNTDSLTDVYFDLESVGLWTRTRYHAYQVGICRGGQFLNVMNGGKMKQHINGHGLAGTHPLYYVGHKYNVTSTHHQEMVPNDDRWGCWYCAAEDEVVEVVVYDRTLCFQPHPEYHGALETETLFFKLLEERIDESYY